MNHRKHIKAQKKLKGIAFKLYLDPVSQLNSIPMSYKKELDVLYHVLTQQRDDKNTIYSIHEPDVQCISKGLSISSMRLGTRVHLHIPMAQR